MSNEIEKIEWISGYSLQDNREHLEGIDIWPLGGKELLMFIDKLNELITTLNQLKEDK
jgi:hypothetical protein